MFGLFKKSKPALPPFETLAGYANKDKYFYRVAQWYWLTDKEITIIDPNAPRFITLDPWPQLVYLDAKGNMTISQYIEYLMN